MARSKFKFIEKSSNDKNKSKADTALREKYASSTESQVLRSSFL